MESVLYQKLPADRKPFCTVVIGNKSYFDDDIFSVSIKYGGDPKSPAVPTATVEIYGTLPIAYNEPFIVTVNNASSAAAQQRFTGRVGEQSINDYATYTTTTVIATATSIALFRSQAKINMPKNGSIAYLITQLKNEISRKSLGNIDIAYTAANNVDRLPEDKEMTPKDIIAICTKNAVSITHDRSGLLRFTHPFDKNNELVSRVDTMPPILRDQVIAPAEYVQPVSYMDCRTEARVLFQGDPVHYKSDLTEFYLPAGAPTPVDIEVLDLTDIAYTKEENHWRYPLRVATYQNLMLAYQLQGMEIDLLDLMGGSEYDRMVYDVIILLNEGDFISLGGDWQHYTIGPKSVLAYTEKITADGYTITLDLLDPRIHFGLNDWLTPLPAPPVYVWEQAAIQWDNETRTWEGA